MSTKENGAIGPSILSQLMPDFTYHSKILDDEFYDYSRSTAIIAPLHEFADQINTSGELHSLIEKCAKPDQRVIPGQYLIRSVNAVDEQDRRSGGRSYYLDMDGKRIRGYNKKLYDHRFHLDGNYGFALGFRSIMPEVSKPSFKSSIFSHLSGNKSQQEPVWLGVGSFHIIDGRPQVVQLQGGYYNQKEENYDNAKEIMSRFKWPQVLVTLIGSWAKGVGFKEIAVQPSGHNTYVSYSFPMKRAYQRYDLTARTLGGVLKPAEHKSAYVLSLL
jgi:hypothetical protein